MDTDGFVAKDGQCEYCSTSKALALDVFRLISSLGLRTYIKTGDAKIYGRFISKKYRIFFTPNSNDKIFKIARKQRRVRNKTKKDRCHNFKFIKSVEPVEVRSGNAFKLKAAYIASGNSLSQRITANWAPASSRLRFRQAAGSYSDRTYYL